MAAKAVLSLASASILALHCLAAHAAPGQAPRAAAVETGGEAACTALSRAVLTDTDIISAAFQPANLPISGATARASDGSGSTVSISGLPAFCRVVGRIHPEPGSDIRFEVWLPAQWNGRYLGVGNGGLAGSIRYRDLGDAMRTGHATASTDTGHVAELPHEASWATGNPVKLRDYGWRAIHLTAVNAKQLVAAYYGRAADKSYFQSCSNGGRQGLMEASRFPEDYDGILAGAPAAQITRSIGTMLWTQQAQRAPGAALRPEQMLFLQGEVLRQCDRLDGLNDGLIDDPRVCRPDLARLSCGKSSAPQCFSAPQIKALGQIYAGPPRPADAPRSFAFLASGAEAGNPVPFLGWDGYITAGGKAPPQGSLLAAGVLQSLMSPPLGPVENFNWKTDPPRISAALSGVLDVQPDLSRFFEHGGKLILYHGWADAAIPPEQTIDFYDNVFKQSGPKAAASTRLFMIPGMQHCMGGTGAELFGELNAPAKDARPENNIAMALRQWVEGGRAPESVIGVSRAAPASSGAAPARERLHCAFPARAVLTPGADPDKAASYVCPPADAAHQR
ncbi:tannase/feruloyl esterase family alpha/beta hydrolase [Sphingobium sp. JS3065]|uniref:tannase/feruloyl esterase family alpha/beta hydrolase n=1 Tax=Sphingobium sp. JS3065 TaxID=2970925 RepID=UPI002264704B|nr:tannase/feruloyl esterase family alpha/beta hydrolase [Sphingobium sp. JS3065]UZW57399.1 tannase/feruloyl esterase family alpha/beta hydrolase [Sphingobium sp. JS3065]